MTTPTPADPHRHDYLPWLFESEATDEQRREQSEWQQALLGRGLCHIGEGSYLSPLAAIHDTGLSIGDSSYIAAHVYLTGDVVIGDNSSVNPYAVVRGTVRIGDGVRIGAHASIVGFNHTMGPDQPVYRQPLTSKGITVGDDVWIGSNVIIVDGVTIGDHSVIGAGAVVTKDVTPWSIMAGNPARRIRDRRDDTRHAKQPASLAARLAAFADQARDTATTVLDRHWQPEHTAFVNQPSAAPQLRATADAVEIADLLLHAPPPPTSAADLIERLAGRQDPHTGLFTEIGQPAPASLDDSSAYLILSAGYALDLLGTSLRHPVCAAQHLDPARLTARLDQLPWATAAWTAGAWLDGYATALHWNRHLFDLPIEAETMFGWLLTRQDRWTGLWGTPTPGERLRQPVNGYYRLTRGTFAQYGLPVPRPEQTIDTVLAHTRDPELFADGRGTACDVLDVIHPLWLCGQQTRHRRDEVQRWARERLDATLPRWQHGAGFAFSPAPLPGTTDHQPSLMGTEMWLAIIWLLADVLGDSGALGYRPRGVHRPEPAR